MLRAIESVLGIITPFASQKGELSKALTEAGYKVNDIKLRYSACFTRG